MGRPMLANLLQRGFSVAAYDIVPAALDAAAQQIYRLASAHGFGRKDFSSVYQFLKPSNEDAPV